MNISIKEVPETLHRKLKERAESHGRSLNRELISILEHTLNPVKRDPAGLLQRIHRHREQMPFTVKQDDLKAIIEDGRS